MSHLPILPVLVPMFAGALLLVLGASMDTKRALSLLATFLHIAAFLYSSKYWSDFSNTV